MPQYDSPAALRMKTLHVRGKEAVSPGVLDAHKHPLGGEGRLSGKGWSPKNFHTFKGEG